MLKKKITSVYHWLYSDYVLEFNLLPLSKSLNVNIKLETKTHVAETDVQTACLSVSSLATSLTYSV